MKVSRYWEAGIARKLGLILDFNCRWQQNLKYTCNLAQVTFDLYRNTKACFLMLEIKSNVKKKKNGNTFVKLEGDIGHRKMQDRYFRDSYF